MKRYCLALDLKDDPEKIKKYQELHQKIWESVEQNIRQRGVLDMQIWQVENRLFMLMDTTDDYDEIRAEQIALSNPENLEWENLMLEFQQKLPSAKANEKWISMTKIFDLNQ